MLVKKKYTAILLILFSIILIYINFLLIKPKNTEANIILNSNNLNIINQGKKIYLEYCSSCHGVNLEGQTNWMSRLPNGMMPAPPHDKTGHTWHHTDKYLYMITKYGIEKIIGQKYPNNMPIYKDILSDLEIISVLSYIKSTWPIKIKKIHDDINLRNNN